MGGVRSKRKTQKTQKGNPHKLTCRQHILPRRTIERFAGKDGLVSVLFLKGPKCGKSERLSTKNDLFCAKRAWDQRSEITTKKVYEDPFQELAERIVSGKTQSLNPQDNIIATAFWGLWGARFLAKLDPPQNRTAIGCTGIESKDLRETIEKNHGMFINPDSTFPGRALAGMDIQKRVDRTLTEYESLNWTIVEAEESEFIVPDCPRLFYIPISPKIGLIANEEDITVLNKSLFEVSDKYIFGKSINFEADKWEP